LQNQATFGNPQWSKSPNDEDLNRFDQWTSRERLMEFLRAPVKNGQQPYGAGWSLALAPIGRLLAVSPVTTPIQGYGKVAQSQSSSAPEQSPEPQKAEGEAQRVVSELANEKGEVPSELSRNRRRRGICSRNPGAGRYTSQIESPRIPRRPPCSNFFTEKNLSRVIILLDGGPQGRRGLKKLSGCNAMTCI
jgi:hypothetical protein